MGFRTVTDLAIGQAGAEDACKNREFYLGEGVTLEQTSDHIHLAFDQPWRVLSSAVLNGGFCQVNHFLNMRVPKCCPIALEDPAKTLARYCCDRGWGEPAVGMMTAASMKSLRVVHEEIAGESLAVLVTTGLDNARRAGDPAEFSALASVPNKVGTINMAVLSSAYLTDAAMVEMVAVVTEAKAAALQELNVRSPLSGKLATGTGTDSIALFSNTKISEESGQNGQLVKFAGKHTLMGERVAQMVIRAVRSSISYPSTGNQRETSC